MKRPKRSYLLQPHEESLREGLSAEIPKPLICGVHADYRLQEKAHGLHHLRDHHVHCHRHVHAFICCRNGLWFMLALLFLDYLRNKASSLMKELKCFLVLLLSTFKFKCFIVTLIKQVTKYSKQVMLFLSTRDPIFISVPTSSDNFNFLHQIRSSM